MRRKGTISLKDKAMAQEYVINGGNKTAAIAKTDKISMDKANNKLVMFDKPEVQNYIAKLLDKAGMDDESVAKRLGKLLKSSSSKASLKYARPEHLLKVSRMIFELKDRFPADRKQMDIRGININLTGKDSNELNQSLDDVMAELQALKDKTAHSDDIA